MKTIEVNSCNDCPFLALHMDGWGGCYCNHPETEGYDNFGDDRNIPPTWCPLKTQTITIKLKDNEARPE